MKYIKMENISENYQKNLSWIIFSIICKNNDGSYYSIINDEDNWISIDQKNVPSIKI